MARSVKNAKAPARKRAKGAARVEPLVISLNGPGMGPLLRAGLGGLAASLRAILHMRDRSAQWPQPVPLGPGTATVTADRISIDWGEKPPEQTLDNLFRATFGIRKPPGIFDIVGTYEPEAPPNLGLAVAIQDSLRMTFLQHGKSSKGDKKPRATTVEIDDHAFTVTLQPRTWFAHQGAAPGIAKALRGRGCELAGWAYPGAVQRHVRFTESKIRYPAGMALCGVFAIVGCVTYATRPGRGGALVIPEPADLVEFARLRPIIGPKSVAEATVTGLGDAVLSVELSLRLERLSGLAGAVRAVSGVRFGTQPWSTQQKTRVALVRASALPDATLDVYDAIVRTLPTTIKVRGAAGSSADTGQTGYFVATSALRGFLTDNLASGRRWFSDFATARTAEKNPRFIHRYRQGTNDLGALFFPERKGLIMMLQHLEEAELTLVRSVHVALRQRFGAIAEEVATVRRR